MPWAGRHLADKRMEPVSWFDYTDDEKEMRSLGYGLLMPAHPRDRWNQFWAELRRTRITDPFKHRPDPKGYCKTLLGETFTSSHTRYAKLFADIRADRARIPPFCAKARQVLARDEVRLRAVAALAPEREDAIQAKDRVTENQMVADFVREGVRDHIEGFRCTLNKLVISQPEPDSVMVEHELTLLEQDLANWCVNSPSFRRFEREKAGAGSGGGYFPGVRQKAIRKGYDRDDEVQGPVIPK